MADRVFAQHNDLWYIIYFIFIMVMEGMGAFNLDCLFSINLQNHIFGLIDVPVALKELDGL